MGATLCAAALMSAPAVAAGVACKAARSTADRLVCATPELSATDADLNQLYGRLAVRPEDREQRQRQQRWIEQRDACASDLRCARAAYVNRISELLKSPALKLTATSLSSGETVVDLKGGWMIDESDGMPIQAFCKHVRDFANQVAPRWLRAKNGASYSASCPSAIVEAPFFDTPPWKVLEPSAHRELIERLLRYEHENVAYFSGPHKRDGAYYVDQASKFINGGGKLKLWSTHLLDFFASADGKTTLGSTTRIQHLAQLVFPDQRNVGPQTDDAGCAHGIEDAKLFLVAADLAGPAPMAYPALQSAVLRLYHNEPVLIQPDYAAVWLSFPTSTQFENCTIRLVNDLNL